MTLQRWEYLILKSKMNYGTTKYYINDQMQPTLKDGSLPQIVNQLGGQGWELVGVNADEGALAYIFKRPTDQAPKVPKPKPAA